MKTLIAARKHSIEAEAIHMSVVDGVAPLSACLTLQLLGLLRFGNNSVLDFSAEISKSLVVVTAGLDRWH